ncbi:MAG: hypothetical protein ACRD2J_01410 [Thermoanaerobaculia bacterium]
MTCAEATAIEMEMVEQVVDGIGDLTPESVSEDGETIRVRLQRSRGRKLASLVFSRAGLRKLESDPQRAIKLEYLRKDIARAAASRREYRYPHSLGMRF